MIVLEFEIHTTLPLNLHISAFIVLGLNVCTTTTKHIPLYFRQVRLGFQKEAKEDIPVSHISKQFYFKK